MKILPFLLLLICFASSAQDTKVKIKGKSEVNITENSDPSKQPLFVLNGKTIKEGEIKDLEPSDIHKIEVLKDESAINLYGKKAKNGVVIIYTKSYWKEHMKEESDSDGN